MAFNLINLDRLTKFFNELKTWLSANYATKAQGNKADTAIQNVKLNGITLSKDGNNAVNVNLENIVASIYSSSATYDLDDYVIHENALYRCTTAISQAEDWNSSHWTAALATNIFTGSSPGLVPSATSGDIGKMLSGDGTWRDPVEISYDPQEEELHLDFSVQNVQSN